MVEKIQTLLSVYMNRGSLDKDKQKTLLNPVI